MPRSTSDSAEPRPAPEEDRWTSVHIHTGGDADALLVEGIAPIVARLSAADLIERWFFVRYWVEGPHIRLRLRRRSGVPAARVEHIVRSDVVEYLRAHPSPATTAFDPDRCRELYLAEYGTAAWAAAYGRSGRMPMRPNDTCRFVGYVPEIDLYGGPEGAELAERHFQVSSAQVLELRRGAPPGRSVRLGQALRLMLALAVAAVGDAGDVPAVAAFLTRYRDRWERWQGLDAHGATAWHERYDAGYERSAARMRPVVAQALAAGSAPETDRVWRTHVGELRAAIAELAAARRLVRSSNDRPVPFTGPSAAAAALFPSYLHMTSNRLGVSIAEEAYAAHVLARALRAHAGAVRDGESAVPSFRPRYPRGNP